MCSRVPVVSGRSRPISRPRIPTTSDQFGVSVAISGDTLAVGAQFEARR